MIIDKQCKMCGNYAANIKKHLCSDPVNEAIPPRLHNKWRKRRRQEIRSAIFFMASGERRPRRSTTSLRTLKRLLHKYQHRQIELDGELQALFHLVLKKLHAEATAKVAKAVPDEYAQALK